MIAPVYSLCALKEDFDQFIHLYPNVQFNYVEITVFIYDRDSNEYRNLKNNFYIVTPDGLKVYNILETLA